MARYWNHKNLTISGLEPGSRVFVATTHSDGNIDEHVFNERITTENVEVAVPPGKLFLRIRKPALRTFETTFDMITDDHHITVIKVKDE